MNDIDSALASHRKARDGRLELVASALRDADWDALKTHFATLCEAIERESDFDEQTLFPALLAAAPASAGTIAQIRHARKAMTALLARLGGASARHDAAGWHRTFELMRAQLARTDAAREAGVFARACDGLDLRENARLAAAARSLEAPDHGMTHLDLRDLEPPEPFLRIVEQLGQQPPAPFRVLVPREPVPLYEVLREQGFKYRGSPREDGSYELVIEPGAAPGSAPR